MRGVGDSGINQRIKVARFFLATAFDTVNRSRADILERLLRSWGHDAVFGNGLDGNSISAAVQERIEAADALVGLFTRRAELGIGGWATHPWVIQEATWAKARGKRVLPIVEEGVQLGGIWGDVEEARFVAGRFEECIPAVMSFAEAIAQDASGAAPLQAVVRRQAYSVIPMGEVEESWGPEVKRLVEETRALAAAEQFSEALELSSKALRLNPECWRARINRGVALVHLRRYEEAEREFDAVAATFVSMATVVAIALHNKAWLLGVRDGLGDGKSLARRKELYLQALALDNRRIFTRSMVLICMVLLHEEDQARPFLEASLKWEGFVRALKEEIQALGGLGLRVLEQLPSWLRDVLFPHEGINTTGDLQ